MSEAMIIEPTKNDWWIDSGATRQVWKLRACFVKINDVSLGDLRLSMGNKTYYDVLGVVDWNIVLKNHISFSRMY